MSEWEPATDAEVAMRDALRTDDQESYFRILSGVDLLLPVSADALAGLAPLGWGTWSTGGRTHVLAFTSTDALQACLADYTGSARRVPYAELADTWPNLEWWLAVNPGLPIEGYLPAWFVAQLSRGDLRLPTRGPGREKSQSNRIQDLHSAAIAANAAAANKEQTAAPAQQPGYPQRPTSVPPAGYPQQPGGGVPSGYPQPTSAPPATYPPAAYAQPSSAPPAGFAQPSSGAPAAYGRPGSAAAAGFPQRPSSGVPSGSPQPSSAPPAAHPPAAYAQQPSSAPPAGYTQAAAAGYPQPSSAPPAGYAQPSSGAPAAYGRPGSPLSAGYPRPTSAPPAGHPQPSSAPPASFPQPSSSPPLSGAPASYARAAAMAGQPPGFPAPEDERPAQAQAQAQTPPPARPEAQVGPGGLPIRSPGAVLPSGLPSRTPPPPPAEPAASAVPPAYRPPSVPGEPAAAGWPGRDPRGPAPVGPLPVRKPMANTPPVPEHLTPQHPAAPPAEMPRGGFPQGPASPQAAAAQRTGMAEQPAPGVGSPLPRRQAGSGAESSPLTSFPAFKTPAERAATASAAPPAAPARPGMIPPVIPGSPGSDRPARLGSAPPLEVRGAGAVPPVRPVAPGGGPQPPAQPSFVPANDVERELYGAADGGSTDQFLSTLLLATVLVPVAQHSRPGSAPGESGFAFRTEEMEGEQYLVVFTSKDRLAEHFAEPTRTVSVRFLELIRNWPDPAWSFAVNPGSPIGAKYPGPQVIALANWATEAGLGAEPAEAEEAQAPIPPPAPVNDEAQHATVMQKTLPPEQVDYYLERGYDRVAGFVHRATEVEHLRTPAELFGALGLMFDGSPHQADAKEAYVLRWPAYRPSLYRIPYGGQNEQALRAMDGWVIERAPFRGNGFAPGEGRDVIAEFKVDSVRLPHGAQLWRIDADSTEHMVAIFDNDGPQWRRVGEQS